MGDELADGGRTVTLISPTQAGQRNRSRVLRTLYARGPMARVELATAIGATRATIGQIVQPLLDTGLLAEGEPRASAALGGRRARPLWFARHGWTMAAVHLLPGRVRVASVGAGGEVFVCADRTFDRRRVSHTGIVETIADALRAVVAETGSTVRAVGLAVAGLVHTTHGEIVAMHLMPRAAGLAVSERVSEQVGLPVHVDQHPRAQALGDLLFGDARGMSSFVSLYTGEALGAGLIMDGSLHRGPGGAGGEVGHSFVDVNGAPCHCGQRGCWETIATTRWMRRRAGELELPGAGQLTAARARERADGGEAAAQTLLDEYARNLAYGIANLHQTVAPEMFLLHGDVVGAGAAFGERLRDRIAELVPRHPAIRPRIVLADVDDHATLRGAASLALFQTLELDSV